MTTRAGNYLFATVLAGFFLATVQLSYAQDSQEEKVPETPTEPAGAESGDATAGEATPAGEEAGPADGAAIPEDGAQADGEAPIGLRLRRLQQRVQALKERAWRAKARIGMLKEAVIGGGIGARASIVHKNQMGSSFKLIKLVYALDGAQIFSRTDETGGLDKQKKIDVLTGPIAPGSHTLNVLAVYRGNGFGVFRYLSKFTFRVRSSHTFESGEGRATSIEVEGIEKGGATTRLQDRPALDFKVKQSAATAS